MFHVWGYIKGTRSVGLQRLLYPTMTEKTFKSKLKKGILEHLLPERKPTLSLTQDI
jgi:hypothetical protein